VSQRRSLGWCLGLVACCAAWAPPLRAQSVPTSTLRLEWGAPVDCPSSSDVLAETKRLLGAPPTPPAGENWTAHATVTYRGIWSVDLEVRTRGVQHRRLQAQTCRGLADATALILALMIDPDAAGVRAASAAASGGASSDAGAIGPAGVGAQVSTASSSNGEVNAATHALPISEGSQDSSKAAAGAPSSTQVASSDVARRRLNNIREPVELPPADVAGGSLENAPVRSEHIEPGASRGGAPRLFLEAPISFEAGPVPGIDYGVGAAIGLRFGSFRVEASFTDWLRPAVASVAEPTGAGGTFRMASGALAACYVVRAGRFELGPCGEIEAGQVEATGLGVTHGATAEVPWFAAGAGLFAAVRVAEAWAIPLHIDALVPLARRDFMLQNVPSVVYRSSVVGGRLSLGLEYRF
jgi:hypothetical protein